MTIINKYAKYYEFDDLYQVSIIGMMKAYQNYKQGFGVKFTTYAYKYILSEVLLYINNNKTIKVSRDYLKLYKKFQKCDNYRCYSSFGFSLFSLFYMLGDQISY